MIIIELIMLSDTAENANKIPGFISVNPGLTTIRAPNKPTTIATQRRVLEISPRKKIAAMQPNTGRVNPIAAISPSGIYIAAKKKQVTLR